MLLWGHFSGFWYDHVLTELHTTNWDSVSSQEQHTDANYEERQLLKAMDLVLEQGLKG